MELTPSERGQLRQLISQPQWQTAQRLVDMLCSQIALNPKIRDTQWETLKNAVFDEGQVAGIRRLIQLMYDEAQK